MNHVTLEYSGAWSFGYSDKIPVPKDEEIPGPGTYNPQLSKSSAAWTQSKNDRVSTFIRDGQGVAVGSYTPSSKSTVPNETRYSFGVSSRNKPIKTLTRETNYTPGLTLAKEKPPSYSFGYLPDAPNNFNTPSPSHYNTNNSTKTSFNKTQNYFTLGDRQLGKPQVPGVGEYNIENPTAQSTIHKFGTSRRPSPRSGSADKIYNVGGELVNYDKGKSIGQRLRISSTFSATPYPPPGTYNPKSPGSKQRIISMYENRTSIIPKHSQQVPGPGSYDVNKQSDAFSDSSRKNLIAFCKSKRPNTVHNHNPGPGTYATHSNLKTMLGYMSKKLKGATEFVGPSPQDYNPKEMLGQTRHSLVMYSNRADFSKSDTKDIGPGQYNMERTLNGELGRIGKSKRNALTNRNPGPGSYEIPTTIGRLPRYFSQVKRKITESGEAKVIKYDPKKTAEIKLTLTKTKKEQK